MVDYNEQNVVADMNVEVVAPLLVSVERPELQDGVLTPECKEKVHIPWTQTAISRLTPGTLRRGLTERSNRFLFLTHGFQ